MEDNNNINPWKIINSDSIYENPWIEVLHHDVINPNGGKGIYGKVHFKNLAIGIIPVDENGNTWLVGQYRFPLNEWSWEIPEGGGLLVDNPLFSAGRELKEETGLIANTYKKILEMHLSNSVTDEFAIIYLATELTQDIATPEETELLEIKKLPLKEVFKMVSEGIITDSMSVAGLLKLENMLLKKEIIFSSFSL
jgi:ADP-ribose pyrophosphatase